MNIDDTISRRSAIDALTGLAVPRYRDPECEDMWERDRTINRAIDVMRNLPSVQQKVGVWVRIAPAGIYECSACGQVIIPSDIDSYKWCHGCGAKMKGKTAYERNEVMKLD